MAKRQHTAIAHQQVEAASEKNGDENFGAEINEANRRREPHGEKGDHGHKRQRDGRSVGLVLQHAQGCAA